MSKKVLLATFLGGLVLLVLLLTGCPATTQENDAPANDTNATQDDDGSVAAAVTYACPMHPDQTSDDPDATCPICHMDMVPESEIGEHEDMADMPMYWCPMHNEETSMDPNAKCPQCGMDMVPMDDEGHDDDHMDGMDNGDEENGDEHEGMEESGPTADLALGEEAYNANCLACHSIGGGDGVGPDLEGTGEKHGYDTMVGIIKDPEGVGIEYMPSFAQLDDETIDAIVQYLGIYPGHEVDPGMHHGHEH